MSHRVFHHARRSYAVWLAITACTWCPCLAADPSERELLAYIEQLGAPEFFVREEATRRLLDVGQPVIPLLNSAAASTDREVRDRSRHVISLIHQRARTALLVTFRAGGATDTGDSDVPGWSSFRERYGDTPRSRQVFAQMLESEWLLLERIYSLTPTLPENEQADDRRSAINDRYVRLQRSEANRLGSDFNLGLGTMLTFFLVGADFPEDVLIHDRLLRFSRSARLQPILNANSRHEASERAIVRQIFGDWIVAAPASLNQSSVLMTCQVFGMAAETKSIAQKILQRDSERAVIQKSAMEALVIFKARDKSSLIEPFLKDDRVLSSSRDKRQVQVRDVALACLMQLHGHDVRTIGAVPANSARVAFQRGTLGFRSEEDRRKAFDAWKELQGDPSENNSP